MHAMNAAISRNLPAAASQSCVARVECSRLARNGLASCSDVRALRLAASAPRTAHRQAAVVRASLALSPQTAEVEPFSLARILGEKPASREDADASSVVSSARSSSSATGRSCGGRAAAACNPAAGAASKSSDDAGSFDLGWEPFDRSRYKAQGVLGSGGYGTVYLAVDLTTEAKVAVKRIPKARKNSGAAKVQANLQKEATLLEAMQHSGSVVRLLNKYEDERNAYLVLEHLEGGTVEEYVHTHRRDLTEDDIAAAMAPVFAFLADCHGSDVVFADVKPSNFMLGHAADNWHELQLKVIDFGCSQSVADGQYARVRTGTYKYFAPEVFKQQYRTEADCWSAGIMMYRIMTGRYPWWRPSHKVSPVDAMEEICSSEPVPFPGSVWGKWSPEAKDLVMGLLQRDTDARMTAEEALNHPFFRAHVERQSHHFSSNVVTIPSSLGVCKANACQTAAQSSCAAA